MAKLRYAVLLHHLWLIASKLEDGRKGPSLKGSLFNPILFMAMNSASVLLAYPVLMLHIARTSSFQELLYELHKTKPDGINSRCCLSLKHPCSYPPPDRSTLGKEQPVCIGNGRCHSVEIDYLLLAGRGR